MTEKVWLTDTEVGRRFGSTRQWVWTQARNNPQFRRPVKITPRWLRWCLQEIEAFEQEARAARGQCISLGRQKGGYHERKQGKRLGELTGFTFERNLEQRREADHLGDLLCSDALCPFVIENKYRSQGNSILAGAWEQACRTAFKSDRWPSVIWQNGRTAPRCRILLSVIGCAQVGYELISFGTADLSLEDYADLAMRLMGISKT